MKTSVKIILALMTIGAMSCASPYMFKLNTNSYITRTPAIYGENKSHLDSLEVYADNAMILHNGSIVSLALSEKTQLFADVTTELLRGDGIRFAFRTVPNTYKNHPEIAFDYTTEKSVVSINNTIIRVVDSVKAKLNSPARVNIYNDGKVFCIKVDCDTVIYYRCELPNTEYVIFETNPTTMAKLTGISVNTTREEGEQHFIRRPD